MGGKVSAYSFIICLCKSPVLDPLPDSRYIVPWVLASSGYCVPLQPHPSMVLNVCVKGGLLLYKESSYLISVQGNIIETANSK